MIGWVDASAGASGDMLLGALVGAGVPVDVLQSAVSSVVPVRLSVSSVSRAGFAALRCAPVLPTAATGPDPVSGSRPGPVSQPVTGPRPSSVRDSESGSVPGSASGSVAGSVAGSVPGPAAGSAPDPVAGDGHPHRTWADVAALLAASSLAPPVRSRAQAAFAALAAAEGAVHGIPPEEVTFHEVGALDAIADVVGVCAGFVHLGLDRLVVSPVAVGSGRVGSEHGSLPVPAPAVVELLRGVPTLAGPGDRESCTPTGAALLRTWASGFGSQPAMAVSDIGIGAGSRDPAAHANVVRLLVGHPPDDSAGTVVLLEANVDDQDPRVWPTVLADLLSAGAVDAWLVPITMKKGRPAHTVCALVPPAAAAAVRSVLFTATSTIGVRESTRSRTVLDREIRTITVHGHAVRVKIARHAGTVVDAQPEFDDVEAAARALGLPVRTVLTDAVRAVPESWYTEPARPDPRPPPLS